MTAVSWMVLPKELLTDVRKFSQVQPADGPTIAWPRYGCGCVEQIDGLVLCQRHYGWLDGFWTMYGKMTTEP